MGKIFSFETLNGYVRSFDENPKSEIEVSQEAGITSLQPPPPRLPLVGHTPERLADMGRRAEPEYVVYFATLYSMRALLVD